MSSKKAEMTVQASSCSRVFFCEREAEVRKKEGGREEKRAARERERERERERGGSPAKRSIPCHSACTLFPSCALRGWSQEINNLTAEAKQSTEETARGKKAGPAKKLEPSNIDLATSRL